MNIAMRARILAAVLAAGAAGACTPATKDEPQPRAEPTIRETQKSKPTGSHIVERSESRKKTPKNSSSAPVQDLSKSPAATIIPNQPPRD